jgi:hypothetical protein
MHLTLDCFVALAMTGNKSVFPDHIQHTGFVPSGRLVYIGGHYPASLWHTTPWMAFLAGWATTARIRI